MARKKRDFWEFKKQMRRQRYDNAELIKERYPQIEEITIKFTFRDHEGHSEPFKQEHPFVPNSKAFFEFDCPHRECIDGGFNLTHAISDMIGEGNSNHTGTLTCQGW